MQSVSSELARSVLDAAPDAMIIIDDAGVIFFANRQVSTLFGYPHVDIIGKPVEFLMPERFRDRHLAHRQSYARACASGPWERDWNCSASAWMGRNFRSRSA